MKSEFEKNYTKTGYLMNYKKGADVAPFNKQVMQFKIEMPEILPLIWRRILVPSDYIFWDLHVAIQDSMGWSDYHLHNFIFKGRGKNPDILIGIPDFDGGEDLPEVFPSWEIPVYQYFTTLGVTAKYKYDYGDRWWHTVQLEGYIFKEKKMKYPVCIDGERACPPEDCGGVDAYYELLRTLSNPKRRDYKEMKQWVGPKWNAEKFDKNGIKFWDPKKRWKIAFFEKE